MARLAAYYQEDFHYASIGYGPKQRKAAYFIYEEPKNNLFNSSFQNGPRLRGLAASDPALSPVTYPKKTAVMTLKQRPNYYDSPLVENSRLAVQRLQNVYDAPDSPCVSLRHPSDVYEMESVYSYRTDNKCSTKSKHKLKDPCRKRMSYNETFDICPRSPDSFIPESGTRYEVPHALHNYEAYRNGYFIDRTEDSFYPPVSYRSDSSHEKWLQWPWASSEIYANPALLSPPSPLDSGLSSQSITSTPSLDAEPIPVHTGPLVISHSERNHICSCPKSMYSETGRLLSPPSTYDSGRGSPGMYCTPLQHSNSSVRVKKCRKNPHKLAAYVKSDFDDAAVHQEHVRYGMMGLIGESVNQEATLPKVPNGNSQERDVFTNGHSPAVFYEYVDENGVPLKRILTCASPSRKSSKNYVKPCVVITEASEKSSSGGAPSSPEQENSDKSPEPESSVSLAVSNSASNSSSVNSSNMELNSDERRKVNKATEKEIRELEDMYKKCNLSDYDLLDRAERRDLPTAHQTKVDQSQGLTRSKSDTLYEVMSPYHNPYERPTRAPPRRRSGMPDRIADDMALRKLNKPVTTSSFSPNENTVTYMLCSSHFTPTVPEINRDILLMDNPDIEYDDLSYRRHYFGKKSKISDPQPPFGIPLRPPPPQRVFNDYLHVAPLEGLQPLCHPRGNPDVIRDDMAYRTLRKDEPERLYYDIAQVYKKKRG
ncbi:hypothetical protein X975_25926, partial [Stegodyphus mimosarum]